MKKAIRFTAPWCNPCKAYAPIFDRVLKNENEWESIVIDIDKPENVDMASKYGVRGIPMTVLEIEGEIVEKKMGLISEKELKDVLENSNGSK